MPRDPTAEATDSLVALYTSHRPFLGQYLWEREDHRWDELVMALLHGGLGIEPTLARRTVQYLSELGLTSVTVLAHADDEKRGFLTGLLIHMGIDNETALKATSIVTRVAKTVNDRWDGYVQRFLRDHGDKMVEDLRRMLTQDGLETTQATTAAILWLQNVANLPLLLSNEADVQRFCARFDLSAKQLVDIIDGLGLNVAVFDDLLAYEQQLVPQHRARKSTRPPTIGKPKPRVLKQGSASGRKHN